MEKSTPRNMTMEKAVASPRKLKSCPFCGGVAVIVPTNVWGESAFRVECVECHSRSNLIMGSTEESAKLTACKCWNQRAIPKTERSN